MGVKSGFVIAFSLLVVLAPGSAEAYIGPGAGISAVGSLVALLAAVLLAVVGFVWYPMKRLVRRGRKTKPATDTAEKEG